MVTLKTKHDVTVTLGWHDSSLAQIEDLCNYYIILLIGIAVFPILSAVAKTSHHHGQCYTLTFRLLVRYKSRMTWNLILKFFSFLILVGRHCI